MNEVFDTFVNENEFKHCEEIWFVTEDYILFDVWTVHDSNAGEVWWDLTYKQVFDCINHIEKNQDKFIGGVTIKILEMIHDED